MAGNMNIETLIKLDITSKNILELFNAPPPESSFLKLDDPKKNIDACNNLFSFIVQSVLSEQITYSENYIYSCKHGNSISISKEDAPFFLFFVASSYLDHILHTVVTSDFKEELLPECFKIKSLKDTIPNIIESSKLPFSYNATILLHHYCMAMSTLYFTKLFSTTVNEIPPTKTMQAIFHRALADFQRSTVLCKNEYEKLAGNRLLHSVLELAATVYDDIAEWQSPHKPSIFSAINIKDLSGLSSRSPVLLKKYGERNVDKLFERQLSLIFQSLGFYVIPSKIGENTVDLICISSDPLNKFTFLVEAKSSKSPYSLPKKDSRAVIDYISNIKQALQSLPNLSFVLFIGQKPSKTIANKLKHLESTTAMPIRYASAEDLANFRESIPGPVSFKVFHDILLTSGSLLNGSTFSNIAACMNAEQEAHNAFVGAMLAARGITPNSRQAWPTAREAGSQLES